MSAIDECIRFVRGEGFGLLANRATDELAQLRARIEELEKQWDDHCAFHGSESPHALQAALYRASDAESHCKSLAEDRSALTRQLEAQKARIEELEGRVERLTAANRDTDRAVAHVHGEWMKATGASSPSDANHLFDLNQELEQNLERALRMAERRYGNHTAAEPAPILTIHRGGPIGGGPER